MICFLDFHDKGNITVNQNHLSLWRIHDFVYHNITNWFTPPLTNAKVIKDNALVDQEGKGGGVIAKQSKKVSRHKTQKKNKRKNLLVKFDLIDLNIFYCIYTCTYTKGSNTSSYNLQGSHLLVKF